MSGRTQSSAALPPGETRLPPVRLLLLVSGRMYGGGQRVVLDLLEQAGLHPDVDPRLCLLGEPVPAFPAVDAEVVAYDGRYDRPISILGAAWRLRGVQERWKPDVLHSHGWDASMIAYLSLCGGAVGHIIHLHTCDTWLASTRVRHRLRRWLTRRMLAKPWTTVVAVSEAVRRHWSDGLGVGAPPMAVVHNGIDAGRFRQSPAELPGGEMVIGTSARLQENKGWEDLLSALAILRAQGLRPRLLAAGEGGFRGELEAEIARRGLGDQVTLLGFVRDMPRFYGCVGLLVLASHSEGYPLTVLEAMASGVPVVATDVGGTREAIRDGVDGLLVPARDPAALAAALGRLIRDGDLRREMGRTARARAESEFSGAESFRKMVGLYRIAAKGDSKAFPSREGG